jgi:excisionase family DNA binding protein
MSLNESAGSNLEQLYTVSEYAQAKRISKRTVWRMIAAKELEAKRLSKRCIRIRVPAEADRAA